MADQPSVFEEQTPVTPEQQPAPQQEQQSQQPAPQEPAQPAPTASSDVFADQLASIRNERGEPKYRDLPTALDALKHSQEYIPQLKQETETLREELTRLKAELEQRGELESTIERLTAKQNQPQDQPQSQGVTEEQLKELLEQQLTQRETQQMMKSNITKVNDAIVQKFGEKAAEVTAQRAKEYGVSVSDLGELAAKSPEMVLALFDVKPSSPQGKSYTSSSANIPPYNQNAEPALERPEKSLLSGATTKEQMAYLKRVQEDTHRSLGVET